MTPSQFRFSSVSVSSKAERDIISFQTFPIGWHYGRGKPPSRGVVDDALEVKALMLQLGAKKIEAFPRVSGEIVVSALNEADTVDVICADTSLYDILIERGDATLVDQKQVSMEKLKEMVRFLEWRVVASSGYSTRNTSLGKGVDLTVPLYRNPPMVFPSLTRPARRAAADVSARTYQNSTKNELRDLPHFSSGFKRTSFQEASSRKTPQRQVTHATS
jgi:hypothetical protein